MHSTARTRAALAQARTMRTLGDYSTHSQDEMFAELADLHSTLAEVEHGIGFSPAARRGVREAIIRQLIAIDREQQRRRTSASPPPRTLDPLVHQRPAAA